MQKLDRSKLWSLEQYATERPAFRAAVIAHKKRRQLPLNDHATLYFEDFTTMKYQVQEMLRVERIFEPDQIEEEIEAYNPLIPDGANWKATFMIEYPDVEERRRALQVLGGIEHRVWTCIGHRPRTFSIANEDLDRSTGEKTAAVHFMRFELDAASIEELRSGATLTFGIDHDLMRCEVNVEGEIRTALLADLD
ncbi:MAG: DUF3501 family protein [Gammaproteobacteria bacterium]|nr:DUF3501 family protein [Gammaproteobacteria bacterium]MDE0368192.1 DUF3501 family protein [Gammaproteobacteria bacterium]